MNTSPKRKTNAELVQRIKDLEAQLPFSHRSALNDIGKAGETLMASAAVLHITALGGRSIVAPVAITNGLSKATIDAIKADIARSFGIITSK